MCKSIIVAFLTFFVINTARAQYHQINQQVRVTNTAHREYLINREIPGQTGDSQGVNYLLLHIAYNGTPLDDYHVMGKITGVRGHGGSWNRKWTVEVNTASAYTSTRGTMIAYNESSRLVTLMYNGARYLAAEINNSSAMYGFSFTGYAMNAAFEIVPHAQVADVQAFYGDGDDITFTGRTIVSSNSPIGSLVVAGAGAGKDGGNDRILSNGLVINASTGGRTTAQGAQLEFAIPASSTPGDAWGAARIITVAGTVQNGNADGKMILGTRRNFNKLNTGPQWYYGNDVIIDQAGNVGVGTLTPQSKLAVNGDITARRVKVTTTGWADFVFDPSYKLPSLYEVERYVQAHKHLPDIPSETEVKEKGIDVGEMNKLLLQKIEEQMLYIIELRKEVDALKGRLEKNGN